MSETYTIRVYEPGDEVGILASFNLVFREICGEGYVDRDLAFWRWEFLDNPVGHRITVGVTADGTVAAHYGGVPQLLDTEFGEATFVHIVDSFVVPEHRAGLKRPGLFVTTAYPWFDLCLEQGDAVMYGYPVATAERIGKRYLEYSFLRSVDYLCREAAAGTDAGPPEVEVEEVAAIPPEADRLAARAAAERRCLIRRDVRYLDWRYRRMPGGDYRVLAARRGGELAGLAVVREQHELVPGACTIADWLVPDAAGDVTDALLARVTAIARAAGRSTLLAVFAPTSPEHAALLARGFQAVPSSDTLERRLTHRIYHPKMTTEWLAESWYYTLGDTDLV